MNESGNYYVGRVVLKVEKTRNIFFSFHLLSSGPGSGSTATNQGMFLYSDWGAGVGRMGRPCDQAASRLGYPSFSSSSFQPCWYSGPPAGAAQRTAFVMTLSTFGS